MLSTQVLLNYAFNSLGHLIKHISTSLPIVQSWKNRRFLRKKRELFSLSIFPKGEGYLRGLDVPNILSRVVGFLSVEVAPYPSWYPCLPCPIVITFKWHSSYGSYVFSFHCKGVQTKKKMKTNNPANTTTTNKQTARKVKQNETSQFKSIQESTLFYR